MMSLVAVLEAIKWLGFLVVNRIGREKIRVFSHQKKKKKNPQKTMKHWNRSVLFLRNQTENQEKKGLDWEKGFGEMGQVVNQKK